MESLKKGNIDSRFENCLMVYSFKNPENSAVLLMDIEIFFAKNKRYLIKYFTFKLGTNLEQSKPTQYPL